MTGCYIVGKQFKFLVIKPKLNSAPVELGIKCKSGAISLLTSKDKWVLWRFITAKI